MRPALALAAAGVLALAGAGAGTAAIVTSGPGAAARGADRPATARYLSLSLCPVARGASMRAALARAVPRSRRVQVQPLGVAAGGRRVYVSARTPLFSGVAELTLATGALRPIRAFARPATDQADGAASGRWLVWAQTYSLSSLDHFTMYAWNAATGRLRRIGASLAGPGHVAWPSPWHAPAVSGHWAAWAQGYGPGGEVEIRLADLRTGRVATVAAGHTQPPFFDGGLLVWPESDTPGSQTTLRAYRLATGRMTALPPVLRAVHGTEFVASDGTRTAYLSPDLTRLYYSPRPRQPARLALTLPTGADFAGLELAPGVLAWTTSAATYLASTKTGAFMKVTPRYGYATGSDSVVLVTDPPRHKSVHPALALHVIRPAALTWPACSAR